MWGGEDVPCTHVHTHIHTYTGRSRGCGIVEFAAALEAKHAIDTMNNTELDGRLIFVREDRG